MEEAAQKLDEDNASDLRLRVCGILRKAKPPEDNMTRQERMALKELQKMEDVVILPADKGNATVLMNKDEYTTKMKDTLDTPTYKELKKDPTAAQEAKIGKVLRELVKKNKMNDALYNKLRPSGCQPPRIYGLPKVHKPEVPLRPIVSCINSPTYQLAKHIASPLTGETDSYVKDSRHFKQIMTEEKLEPEELLVSFDVTSLFTNIPVDEAVEVTRMLLQGDETLGERTALSAENIAELLKLCLKSTYFRFEGKFYEQKEGAAMGSPVSAVIANLYMEHFEHRALESAPQAPRL